MDYNSIGRIIKEIDSNQEIWRFNKDITKMYTDYILTMPENNTKTTRRYIPINKEDIKEEIIYSNGDIFTKITTKEGMTDIFTEDNIISKVVYKNNERLNQKDLTSLTTTQPSGLKRTTTYDIKYVDNIENVTLSKTQTIKTNNKAIVVKKMIMKMLQIQ